MRVKIEEKVYFTSVKMSPIWLSGDKIAIFTVPK